MTALSSSKTNLRLRPKAKLDAASTPEGKPSKRSVRGSRFPAASLLSVIVLALGTSAVGCPCVRGAVNDSPSLRWWLFSNFGAQRMCPEMLKRGVPLKLAAFGNASIGRFFPQQCNVVVDDKNHTIIMNATGSGYAYLPVTKRVGFYCGLSVEYRPDFRFVDDSVYVWGVFNRLMAPPDLRILGVENPLVNLATQTPAGSLATVLGQGVVTNEIGRGFTVVREPDGDDFTMGILSPPAKPVRQFRSGDDHVTLASDLAEIQPQSREYLGPFEVTGGSQALYFKFRVTGAPLAATVVDKQTGDLWRQQYEAAQPLAGPPGFVYGAATLQPGNASQVVTLNRGMYYLVLENQTAPGLAALGVPMLFAPGPATVSYSAELGDRP